MRLIPMLLCTLPAAFAAAGAIYTADSRYVQAQNSFAQNDIKQPVAFTPFNASAASNTTNATGSCSSSASQTSQLTTTAMSGTGAAQSDASASATSGLVYGASGVSSFVIKLKFPVKTSCSFGGQLNGSALHSNVRASIESGGSTLFIRQTTGPFSYQSVVDPGTELLVTVSGSCNAFALYSSSPVTASGSAGFTFQFASAPSCPGDLNSDGQVDDSDFSIFVVGYDMLDCADPNMTPGCPADLNNDGLVDDADFSIFVIAYDALLCP